MAAAVAEEVVSKKPEAEGEPPLAAVENKPVVEPPCDDAKAVAIVPVPEEKKASKGSLDRDIALAKLEDEKRVSFIKAWEEGEISKVENRAQKKIADICSWENTKKAAIENQLKKKEEQLEQQKAEYAEKIKNKIAEIHKQAEEKRATVEAQRGEEILKAEEAAAKFRATKQCPPTSACGCLGG